MPFYKSETFKNEVSQWEKYAGQKLTPEQLAMHFFTFNSKIGLGTLYASTILQLVRKGYVAAMYSQKCQARFVRMTPDKVHSHDCEVTIGDKVQNSRSSRLWRAGANVAMNTRIDQRMRL